MEGPGYYSCDSVKCANQFTETCVDWFCIKVLVNSDYHVGIHFMDPAHYVNLEQIQPLTMITVLSNHITTGAYDYGPGDRAQEDIWREGGDAWGHVPSQPQLINHHESSNTGVCANTGVTGVCECLGHCMCLSLQGLGYCLLIGCGGGGI